MAGSLRILCAALTLICASAPVYAQPASPRLDLERYLSFDEIEAWIDALAAAHPDQVTLRTLGKSREGRPIRVVEVCDASTGAPETKAAMYIDANMHGNEIQGSEVCLYTLDYLLRRRHGDPLAERVFAERVLLVAPCVNPDGRVHFLTDPNTPHSSRHNLRPVDDDLDGRIDEDGYDDLDGDGEILSMRRRVAGGRMRLGEDPRELVPAEIGEEGGWEWLGSEGRDDDGDGRINEDPPGGVDLNRNFPTGWEPREKQHGAGPFPLSEPESRAIVEYLLGWPNLAAVQSYHNFGEMILRPPGSSTDADARMPPGDVAVYDAIGRLGESLLPGYRYLQTHDDLYRVHGGFLDWGYLGRGVFFFTNELWRPGEDRDGDGQISERERLRWNDELLGGAAFRPWQGFDHPDLGRIEIGGWRKLARRIPPAFQLEDMCYRNMRFTLFHADLMPRIAIAATSVTSFSDRLHHLDVTVVNSGLIPTSSQMALRLGLAHDDIVTVTGRHVTVLGSGRLGTLDHHAELEDRHPETASLGSIAGRSSQTVRFVIEGWQDALITVDSTTGGRATTTVRLREEE
jgi:hypothetical protein